MSGMYKTYYDIAGTTLWSQEEGDATSSRLLLSFADGRPRIVSYLTNQGGVLMFPCDHINILGLIEAIDMVSTLEPGSRISMDSIGGKWVNGERTNETEVKAELYIGKANSGVIYLSLKVPNKPTKVYPLINSKWHTLKTKTGEPFEPAQASRLFARGWVNLLRNIVALGTMQHAHDTYVNGEYKPRGVEDRKDTPYLKKGHYNNAPKKEYNNQSSQQQEAKSEPPKEISFDNFSDDVPY